ncbi:competence protein CoiA [Candidatus Enterococcus mansonii]|uniref:Competence protein CoiA n=1 Tax=Candidatus Enterococcus mansonii TaxID=1834181 RepID=A0A242CJ80_9ENTE|nr:competence protein CoiA family protein [Enterococcus sp. 4G2_DIV0659]OTO09960.1 hypothetical protein A5880_000643 [Enterococcus sp. 4G2_DIV0659]
MLNAYSKENQVVTLLNFSRDKIEQLKKEEFFCPACKEPVRIKNGKVNLPHFSHYNNSNCCISNEGETIEHLTLKKALADWCEKESITCELEKYLPEVNQRPDLLIGNLAIEIQCSPLSVQRLVERTHSYQRYGYIPIWICGKKLFSNHQYLGEVTKNLCNYSDNIGFYLWAADWETEEIIVYFHIEEDWKKRVYFSRKSWRFYTSSFLQILCFPNQSTIHHQRIFNIGELLHGYYAELNKKLNKKDEKIRVVQSVLYNNHFHLLTLPSWFYFPGVHLFCCRGSDILLKIKIWRLVACLDQNVIEKKKLSDMLKREIEQSEELLYEMPNVSKREIKKYCVNQLLNHLIACGHLVKNSDGWKIEAKRDTQNPSELYQWLKRMENKCLISATPIKNVIR